MRGVLRSRALWIASFAAWTFVGLFALARDVIGESAGTRSAPSYSDLVLHFESLWVWAVFTVGIVALAEQLPLERSRIGKSLLIHGGAALALSIFDIAVDTALLAPFDLVQRSFVERAIDEAFINVFSYAACAAAGYAVIYARALERDRAVTAQLERRFAEARLEILTARLRPHFLFNTLNSIAALIRLGDREDALKALVALSDLLRAVIEVGGDARVPLKKELEWTERYLAIERLRFQDRLQTTVHVAADVERALVPALVLQPIVENAIRHGIEQRRGAGSVTIEATRSGEFLLLSVRDAGEAAAATSGTGGFGVGLESTRERLAHLYGPERFVLELHPDATGSTAHIRIPFDDTTHAAPAASPNTSEAINRGFLEVEV